MKQKVLWAVVIVAIALPTALFAEGARERAPSTIEFQGVKVPTTDAEKRAVLASPRVTIDGRSYPIGFNTLARSGQVIGGNTFGQIFDINGDPVVESDGSRYISNSNDFASLLPVGGSLFSVNHFESRPGAMYLTELRQNPTTGALTPIRTENIDFSEWGGLWVPCAGSVTPWNTHLGSEEYPPDARAFQEAAAPDEIAGDAAYVIAMARYFGIPDPFAPSVTISQLKSTLNPYYWGYPVEVAVYADGSYRVNKRGAMGRVAVELAYVMPDERTVYITDDGENCVLLMFVADLPGDLSAGTLYAARWVQTSARNGGSADIEWVDLGWASQDEVMAAVKSGIQFSDMFEVSSEPRPGFTSINAYAGGGGGAQMEYLRLKPGMAKMASRLETRRYAALMGATTEFRKEEGVTYDPDGRVLYIAMSEVTRGMEDFARNGKANDKYDKGGANHIRVDAIDGGAVYACNVGTDRRIGSDMVVKDMAAVVTSRDASYPESSPYYGNKHDVERISNPDNVTFLVGHNTLIIGEDTGSGHQNDVIWAWNVETRKLTRIQTTPYGSETTSPYFYPNINGFGYIMSVIQHPYGESDEDKLADPSEAMAYNGYIGPFPAMD
jgi:secreted PhoX family phosphatase